MIGYLLRISHEYSVDLASGLSDIKPVSLNQGGWTLDSWQNFIKCIYPIPKITGLCTVIDKEGLTEKEYFF